MSDIFISYRRGVASPYARGIYERLEEQFGSDRVFMDIDTMEPGVDFVEYIQRAVTSCRVLLVVITPDWVSVVDDTGKRRLDDPDDFVRVEVNAALAREDVRVIPVLVGDAPPPKRAELPPDLAPLIRRQALEVGDGRWDYDLGVLVRTIEKVFDEETDDHDEPPGPRWRIRDVLSRRRVLIGAAVAAVCAAVLAVALAGGGSEPSGNDAPRLTEDEVQGALTEFTRAFEDHDPATLQRLTDGASYSYLRKEMSMDYRSLLRDLEPENVRIQTLGASVDGSSGMADIRYDYVDPHHTPAQCVEGWKHGGTARLSLKDFAASGAAPDVRITAIADRPELNWDTLASPPRKQTFRVFSEKRDAPISSLQQATLAAGSHCVLIELNSNADGLRPEALVHVRGSLQVEGAESQPWGPTEGRLQRGLG
jgi:hypothetical protein